MDPCIRIRYKTGVSILNLSNLVDWVMTVSVSFKRTLLFKKQINYQNLRRWAGKFNSPKGVKMGY
jgi:hypothetical protein